MGTLKIGIVGFGRAGRTAALEVLKDPELRLAWVARRRWKTGSCAGHGQGRRVHLEGRDYLALGAEELADPALMRHHRPDLVIDLAGSDAVNEYAHLAGKGVRLVSAVSHYEEADLHVLRKASRLTPVLHSPNITLGVNLILVVARMLRRLIPHADIQILEEHFADKQGRSGTAERIADMLGLDPDETIRSIRAGGIVGKHELIFGLPNQTVRLVHESINRAAFARGALLAGKWLMDAEPGFYTMEKLVFGRMRKGFLAEAEEEGA
jgi:4-hydroxy-tetrahydrodipicolinate reductase